MHDHEQRPPAALAHGPAKSDDIERLRRDVQHAEAHLIRVADAARDEPEPESAPRPPGSTGRTGRTPP